MRGDTVFVVDAFGRLLVRRVWDVSRRSILICTEDRYQMLSRDYESADPPTAFPKENVYEYDAEIDAAIPTDRQIDTDIFQHLKSYQGI